MGWSGETEREQACVQTGPHHQGEVSKCSAVCGLQRTHFNSLAQQQQHAVKDFSVCPDSVM